MVGEEVRHDLNLMLRQILDFVKEPFTSCPIQIRLENLAVSKTVDQIVFCPRSQIALKYVVLFFRFFIHACLGGPTLVASFSTSLNDAV